MVTAINLLLAVGLCIDYSAHVCHSFMIATGSREERAIRALRHIGPSVIHGGMTTLMSTCVMLAAQSYVFRVISKMFILLVLLGLFFGMALLPVLLSLVGPTKYVVAGHSIVPKAAIGVTQQGSIETSESAHKARQQQKPETELVPLTQTEVV